ncbi:hypothetical protein ABZZ17_09530 [Streptomyces sp. NPDC006512]|uniref:hypothetical protein n=1 Tax=Streptomyces sp. NPDC006512 TaxID=3154307 RepID=UPI0033AFEDD9
MGQDRFSLDGLLGIGADAEGRVFYLRVAGGTTAYERGGEPFDYIQVILYETAAPGRPADANDMFETESLECLADGLRNGALDWYGERLAFRTPTGEELERIRSVTGWR